MNKLPIVIPLEEDELLGSWIYRLARANLITDIDAFIRTYVRAAPGGLMLYSERSEENACL